MRSDRISSCGYIRRYLREEASDAKVDADLLKLPLYPDIAQGVLDTWYERTTVIESMLSQHSFAHTSCRIWPLVTLTKYTELPLEDE